jgi:hypothetical protein
MTARRLTALLFITFVAICGWIYLRDRATAVVLQPGSNVAQADGQRLLNELAPGPGCAIRCRVDVAGSSSPDSWHVLLTGPAWQRCFLITLRAFGYDGQHGFRGLRSENCSRVGS